MCKRVTTPRAYPWLQGATHEKVFPKRRGVLIKISEGQASQSLRRMMSGAAVVQSALYSTRAQARV